MNDQSEMSRRSIYRQSIQTICNSLVIYLYTGTHGSNKSQALLLKGAVVPLLLQDLERQLGALRAQGLSISPSARPSTPPPSPLIESVDDEGGADDDDVEGLTDGGHASAAGDKEEEIPESTSRALPDLESLGPRVLSGQLYVDVHEVDMSGEGRPLALLCCILPICQAHEMSPPPLRYMICQIRTRS